jgi:hypothetical protein
MVAVVVKSNESRKASVAASIMKEEKEIKREEMTGDV